MKLFIEKFSFGYTLSQVFKKSRWLAQGIQMCGPKDMEDPVNSQNSSYN